MATIFMMNEEIARGMVCFFHQKKHSYLIFCSTYIHENENKVFNYTNYFAIMQI
jgi:hypothetical protein